MDFNKAFHDIESLQIIYNSKSHAFFIRIYSQGEALRRIEYSHGQFSPIGIDSVQLHPTLQTSIKHLCNIVALTGHKKAEWNKDKGLSIV